MANLDLMGVLGDVIQKGKTLKIRIEDAFSKH